MNKKVVTDLAKPAVRQEILKVLATYPDHPHQQAFAAPEMLHQLLAYVLNSIPSEYKVVEDHSQHVEAVTLFSEAEVEHLDAVIHQGVYDLLQDKVDWVEHYIPNPENSGESASHWFG